MRNSSTLNCWLLAAILLAGCTASHHRKSADKEVYNIIQEKQRAALGQTNAFSIDTPYSQRKPDDVKGQEIVADRSREAIEKLTLSDALLIAVTNSRDYQNRKERLYISALTLTRERFEFAPHFFAGGGLATDRSQDGKIYAEGVQAGFTKALKTGGALSLRLANDLLRFYSRGRVDSGVTSIALDLSQPLLRGAGAKIAAENLTQAERDVIYEIRSFWHFEDTFAFGIVRDYLNLLRQQDTVKNEYTNFLSSVSLRERAVALSVDRLAPFQADQAVQEELSARNVYILAVERYRTALDEFKITLGLPAGYDLRLDETVLTELETAGLLPVPLTDDQSFRLALDRRLDLLNEIDRFEDSKRKVIVAANSLKADLGLFGTVSYASDENDYARFDLDNYAWKGGVELSLPLNRKLERNAYRSSIIGYESQLRALALFLDELKRDLRIDQRELDRLRQSYDIQVRAKALADRRVESSELSLQAGRVQVRDVVDAQTARVRAYNAATAALVDYHLTRMRLLSNLGILKTDQEKFWLDYGELPVRSDVATPAAPTTTNQLITPKELFQNDQR